MKRRHLWIWMAAVGLASAISAEPEAREAAKRSGKSSTSESAKSAATATPKIYIPPARGATRTRTGGGTRSAMRMPKLEALVPDHVARTARPSPDLFWYVATEVDAPLVLTLLREDAIEPELEKTLTVRVPGGIGRISLGEFGIELESGVVYQWSVALIADPSTHESDVIAGGAIERVAAPPGLDETTGFRELAASGLWYDALAELGDAIEAGDTDLRQSRARLLDEVGLPSVAEYEREAR